MIYISELHPKKENIPLDGYCHKRTRKVQLRKMVPVVNLVVNLVSPKENEKRIHNMLSPPTGKANSIQLAEGAS